MLNIQRLKRKVEEKKSDLIQFLRDVIRIPSPGGKEGEVIARVKLEMERLGYDEVFLSKMGSVIGRIGSGRKKIMYDAHVDTVGVGDLNAWGIDPFLGRYEKDIIYGLGACDTKASVASMVYGGGLIKELGLTGDFTLFVVASVQEEDCEGEADKFIFDKGEIGGKPDFVVIGEPSSLRIARGNKGRVEIRVTTRGISAHASNPSLGENAIYKMAPLIMELENLQLPAHHIMGKGVLCVTAIEAKSSSRNAVPGECTIFIDRRLIPGEIREDVLKSIQILPSIGNACVEIEVYREKSYTDIPIEKEKFFPPWIIEEKHPLLVGARNAYELILTRKPEIFTWDFCTNGNYTAGEADIPSIGFGPGEERFAHTVMDQVSVAHLTDAMSFYTGFPEIFCSIL